MKYPTVRIDDTANAAYLAFTAIANGGSSERIPVKATNGDVIAVLDLSSSGQIVGVEFLNANNRLPTSFLDQYKE
jgi:uncharacterized protein YuzE